LNLSRERDQLLLKLREKEIGRVQATAQQRAEEAKSAKELAAKRRAELEKLRSELEELKARPTDRGMVLTLCDVLFKTNRSTLLPRAAKNIDQLSQFMNKYPDRKIVVEGHTDSRGSAEYNMLLSKRRADSVKNALVEKGIDESRIMTRGYGETHPAASNKTAAGRQQNRRVEVIILDQAANP